MINEYENKMMDNYENKSVGISKKDEVAIENFFRSLASTKKKTQPGRKKKLTPDLQKLVIDQYATGEYTHRQLAEATGVSTETIRRTLNSK
ncbi:helix-turn-helix domain-containing protein [Aeromonas hydrophila]|uniref:helix-turn-helix domain-containing protein n=1 Tax=Aeromonas TaxID=642 RepID=UPI003671D771